MTVRLKKTVLVVAAMLLALPASGRAAVVFSDTFDASPDWQSAESYPSTNAIWPRTWVDNPNGATQPPPKGWTSYRAARPKRGGHEKTFVLSAEGSRNPGGKGMTYNIESISYGTWVGGGLDVYLGNTGHKEMFVRFYLKYDPTTFHWGTAAPAFGKQKLARISRLKVAPTASLAAQNWGTDGYHMPTFFPDIMNNPAYNTPTKTPPSYGVHFNYSHRYDPAYNVTDGTNDVNVWTLPWRSAGTVNPSASWFLSDGQWHCYEYRVKMNSAPGVADGEWEMWIDGGTTPDRHFVKKSIPWVSAGGSINPGWNWVTFMDNSTIQPDPAYANTIMKVFMDDVVVSTHYSGAPPAPASVSAQALSSTSARVKWAAGASTVPVQLDGYRVYYGLDPKNLNSIHYPGAATSADIPNLQAGKTYYFAVTGYHRESGETTDNESLKSATASVTLSATSATPGDTTAPTVSISSPTGGSTVSGTTNLSAAAADNVGVSKVEFYLNSALYGVVGSSPYSMAWNTGSYANGTYQVTAKAYDAAGNSKLSAAVSVNVNNGTATAADTTKPSVTAFTMPTSAASRTVSVSLSATDNVGVAGYLVTESSSTPSASATGWSATAPTSFTFATSGARTAYAWAKDKAGNVSASRSASVNITLPAAGDTTVPVVNSFTMPTSATSPTVAISQFTASDNVGVTAYLVTESGTKPSAGASTWKTAKPTSFTFAGTGTRTAYAWVKDAAGNVSAYKYAKVTVSEPDSAPPVIKIISPAAGSTVPSRVTISASATDKNGILQMRVYVDNVLKKSISSSSISYAWNTSGYAKGAHSIKIYAFDKLRNYSTTTISVNK